MAVDENGNPIIEVVPAANRVEERIIDLSGKVKTEAEGRAAAEARATVAERKAAFAEGFVDIVTANPAAKEFKADIQAKVDAGLSVEDATYAVLGKAGKLGSTIQTQPQAEVAGGSAATSPQSGVKTPGDMTQEERRAELAKELIWN